MESQGLMQGKVTTVITFAGRNMTMYQGGAFTYDCKLDSAFLGQSSCSTVRGRLSCCIHHTEHISSIYRPGKGLYSS